MRYNAKAATMLIRSMTFFLIVFKRLLFFYNVNCEFIDRWGCGPSKFPWTVTATEAIYLLDGKVNVHVDGHEGSFEIGAGDLVVFPKGMKVTWNVTETVKKHYYIL